MRLCIALDMESKEENLALAREISIWRDSHHSLNSGGNGLNSRENLCEKIWLKVGLVSFIRDGRGFIKELQNLGFRIFLDLKLYDIPHTMLNAIKQIQNLNVDMLTIHASAGLRAMREIALHLEREDSGMLVVAVSTLTSFSNEEFKQIYNVDIKSSVRHLANLVYKSGLHGLVCSGDEIEIIKGISHGLVAVTPGVRLQSHGLDSRFKDSRDSLDSRFAIDDQQRVVTPQSAKAKGSDFIVIGRPIYMAKDRISVLDSIVRYL